MEDQSIYKILEKAEESRINEANKANNKVSSDLMELDLYDSAIVASIGEVVSHIVSTFKDKYEDGEPEVDLYNLMRSSQHGKGFNVGNSLKYNKRYLTSGYGKSGDVRDLYKSIHYLLMEIDRIKNEKS